jgi:hypothetical protein
MEFDEVPRLTPERWDFSLIGFYLSREKPIRYVMDE